MGLRIDIGCGKNPRPGFLGLDIEAQGQKYVRDIRNGLPFSDDTVSEINLSHVLEHIHGGDDLFFFLHEMYRVCCHGAKVYIRVPHSDSKEAFDPAHVSYWNERSLVYLSRQDNPSLAVPSYYQWEFKTIKVERSGIELVVEAHVWKPAIAPEVTSSKTSIIIVAYNQLEHTKRCIESIIRWTRSIDYEIIVVNNASTDGTKEYLDDISNKYHHITAYHSEENLGWVRGINKGYEFINPESSFVILSNNDIVVTDTGWLHRLLMHFTETVGAVGPTSNYVIGRQSTAYNHPGIFEEFTNALIGFFMCVRRSVIEQIGLLDERFGIGGSDDYDYSIRIQEAGYTLKIARDVYIHHSGSKSFMPMLGGIEGYDKHWKEKNEVLTDKWGEDKVKKLFLPNLHVVAAVPIRTDYVHRLFAFRFSQMSKPWGWTVVDAPRGLIHDSRNALVEHAIEIGAHYILFIDDDMIPPVDLFLRLFNLQVSVAASLAFKRRPPYDPCIYRWDFSQQAGVTAAVPLYEYVKKGIRQVDATGFGAVLIDMEVFKEIPKPWFELKDMGEDLDFCMKCYDHNIPIWCDTDLIVQHIGDNELVDDESFEKAQREGITGNMVIESHDPDKIRRSLIKK